MNRFKSILSLAAALIFSFFASGHDECWSQNSSADLFERSIKNTNSSASGYVLITVVNDKTGKSKSVCIQAANLLGAIHMQHRLPYTEAGNKRALAIALTTKDHVFHFSNSKALDNTKADYDEKTLTQERHELSKLSRAALINRFEKKNTGHQPTDPLAPTFCWKTIFCRGTPAEGSALCMWFLKRMIPKIEMKTKLQLLIQKIQNQIFNQ